MYRKKPVVIEARLLNLNDYDEACDLVGWCKGEAVDEGIRIYTKEGIMLASDKDYIIKGIQGEFYPCKPDIFEASYEKVE